MKFKKSVLSAVLLAVAVCGYARKKDPELEKLKQMLPSEKDVDLLYQLAVFYEGKKEFLKAELVYRRILEIDPGNTFFSLKLFWLLYKNGRYSRAIRVIDNALKVEETAKLYTAKATALMALKRYKEAGIMFKKALEINPEDGFALSGLGKAKFKSREYRAAKMYLEKAVEIANDYWSHYYLARTLLALRDYKNAVDEFWITLSFPESEDRRSSIVRQLAFASLKLSFILEREGKPDDALSKLKDVLKEVSPKELIYRKIDDRIFELKEKYGLK